MEEDQEEEAEYTEVEYTKAYEDEPIVPTKDVDTSVLTPEDINQLPIENTALYYPHENEQALVGFAPLIVEEMLKHVTLGCNLTDIANIVRLPPARVRNWYDTNYCNFKYAVDYSMADHKRRLLQKLVTADDGLKIKASQFLLERKYRDEYGKEIRIDVNHVMIDNITRVVFETAVKYIKDTDILKLFVNDLSEQLAMIRPSAGIETGQRLST